MPSVLKPGDPPHSYLANLEGFVSEPFVQSAVLERLEHYEKPVKAADLARDIHLHPGSVTQALLRMVRKGYVSRHKVATVYIQRREALTKAGRKQRVRRFPRMTWVYELVLGKN